VVTKQVFACPPIVHPTDPLGLAAPEIPVTVAVKVSVLPSTGLDGDEVTVNEAGVAAVTTIEPVFIGVAGSAP
jgi:hypothetical protein